MSLLLKHIFPDNRIQSRPFVQTSSRTHSHKTPAGKHFKYQRGRQSRALGKQQTTAVFRPLFFSFIWQATHLHPRLASKCFYV